MATVPNNWTFNLQDVVNVIGCAGDLQSCVNAAVSSYYDSTYSSETGLRKFRNYGNKTFTVTLTSIGGISTQSKGSTLYPMLYLNANNAGTVTIYYEFTINGNTQTSGSFSLTVNSSDTCYSCPGIPVPGTTGTYDLRMGTSGTMTVTSNTFSII